MNTIHYYNKYSSDFIESTFDVDMESLYLPFLKNITEGGFVLDLGVGQVEIV